MLQSRGVCCSSLSGGSARSQALTVPFFALSLCCVSFPKLFCEQKLNLKIAKLRAGLGNRLMKQLQSFRDLNFSVLPKAVKGN